MTVESNPGEVTPQAPRRQAAAPPVQAIVNGESAAFPSADEKFRALADEWLTDQAGRSRIDFAHPAYLQIIGMGPVAIPLLLKEVRARSGHWFRALRAIAGLSPVPAESRGDFEAAAEAWLHWGEERQGYFDRTSRFQLT